VSSHLSATSTNNSRHYDKNGFITRPAPIGTVANHYLKLTTRLDRRRTHRLAQHRSRLLSSARRRRPERHRRPARRHQRANGRARIVSRQGLDAPQVVDLLRERRQRSGRFARDRVRHRLRPAVFIGGPFSFFSHQGFNLAGTAVNFKQRDSLVIDFRTSKSEGQANFVNPGALIFGYGFDADVLPNSNVHQRELTFAPSRPKRLSWCCSPTRPATISRSIAARGFEWRPLLTDNVILTAAPDFSSRAGATKTFTAPTPRPFSVSPVPARPCRSFSLQRDRDVDAHVLNESPSTKSQAPGKFQYSNSKGKFHASGLEFGCLELGASLELGAWCLELLKRATVPRLLLTKIDNHTRFIAAAKLDRSDTSGCGPKEVSVVCNAIKALSRCTRPNKTSCSVAPIVTAEMRRGA